MMTSEKPDNQLVLQFGALAWRAAQLRALKPISPPMPTYIFFGSDLTYTLADGLVMGNRVAIKDNVGDAESRPRTIFGKIDGKTSIVLNQNYAALEFVWNDQEWSVF
jgi:hypothetical protein